jgi:catechol 2,3-dioxygenase-like lactoylglutathione lyase family enzyme
MQQLTAKQEFPMHSAFTSSRDVIIRTESWAEAVRFYETVLGLPIVHREKTLVGFETGSFRLYIEMGAAHGPVFDFLVADVERAKAHLLAAGCVVVEQDASVPRCYVRDPQGVVFNIGPAQG